MQTVSPSQVMEETQQSDLLTIFNSKIFNYAIYLNFLKVFDQINISNYLRQEIYHQLLNYFRPCI